jgi:ABC-2 type transport system ATP-binding protein
MTTAIEVLDLVKRYRTVEAVAGVTLEVRQGEIVGYLGPNGAGKTTTIRCMLGLLRPSGGSIRILGRDLRAQREWILERVGHIPGEFSLWPQLTGRQCLDYLAGLHGQRASRRDDLCRRFELTPAQLDRPVRFYSRGMRQKIAIVQAFQHNPELVIMDEPTEGLDPVMKERFIALLAEHRAGGGSALMSSHILSEVEQAADRVAVLRAGRIIKEVGTRDLAGDRVRHCTVTLAAPVAGAVELPGAIALRRDRTTLRFDHRGEMAPLLQTLARLPVIEFLSEPESLLEAFFEIYEQEPR